MKIDYAFNITATEYDDQRKRLIFCHDDFYSAVLRMIPFSSQEQIKVLDLGCGTGLLSAWLRSAYPHAEITLTDASTEMMSGAKERFINQGSINFEICDFSIGIPSGPFDAIVSALAIHHLDACSKRTLFSRIYKILRSGGVFVNADQVRGSTNNIQDKNYCHWRKCAIELGSSESELTRADDRMNAQDQLSTLEDQLDWLKEIGFSDVDCCYKNGWFAVFGGVKQ